MKQERELSRLVVHVERLVRGDWSGGDEELQEHLAAALGALRAALARGREELREISEEAAMARVKEIKAELNELGNRGPTGQVKDAALNGWKALEEMTEGWRFPAD